uniref:F-box/FBD/LRR-repeat protein At4g13965 n=2 Tax=Nicotiana TaxID=4085 RepID=A0A1S4B733_TOBAC|nr:PREDICTED: putative F-box/FBD/LRR-repeat protein At4g13965 [Nicotiana sylvestris]XP_016484603.1 PREDICTED: putative F-box/FBD/LRR-repeat protein At4g13965 [Nicotiana tabacum]
MPIKYAARTSILSKQWRKLWSTQPHLVFDSLFFGYVSNIVGASPASIIHKILMQHIGPILGFHLISKLHELSQSDFDQCIIFVSNHGIEKFTLDVSNVEKDALPCSIFTCSMLTHLKALELEHSELDGQVGSIDLILPMLDTLELRFCVGVDCVNIVSPNLVNLSILSSCTVTFQCFNVNPIFERIKHLCLDGPSLKNLGSFPVLDMLDVSLNLQHLKIYDLKISVKRISSAICLLQSSPNLRDLDMDEVVKVDDEKVSHRTELILICRRHKTK